MDKFWRELRSSVSLSQIVKFAIAFLGLNFDAFVTEIYPGFSLSVWYRALFSLFIIVLLYWTVVRKREFKTTHSFVADSATEAEFFAKWYSRKGRLLIFCTDLDWLSTPLYDKVVDALVRKGNTQILRKNRGVPNLIMHFDN